MEKCSAPLSGVQPASSERPFALQDGCSQVITMLAVVRHLYVQEMIRGSALPDVAVEDVIGIAMDLAEKQWSRAAKIAWEAQHAAR